MAKNQNKTVETTSSVSSFLDKVKDESRRDDAYELVSLMKKVLKVEPKMWGPSIVGFSSYHYKYETGREGDGPLLAFSPRASSFAIYLSGSFEKREELLAKLGKVKAEKGCIHVKKLS